MGEGEGEREREREREREVRGDRSGGRREEGKGENSVYKTFAFIRPHAYITLYM